MQLSFASLLLPILAVALPTDMSARSPLEAAVQERQVDTSRRYCLTGWDQRNFRGRSYRQCCFYGQCCGITNELLVNRLFSAKASGVAGVYLYTDNVCQRNSNRRLIDQEGWRDLSSAPAYHSMNMDG
ncbi:hypothetical protein H2201_009062 [Coniosporium apollinis]|uniref:Uncharacterized protein n=1 Tax=Coniosporium apollinis TaxID=61459 RepID=A0ABQ9NGM3_9PEZI|nr:hypothetical protein H2201_009062 [Coniosporium apollinis]